MKRVTLSMEDDLAEVVRGSLAQLGEKAHVVGVLLSDEDDDSLAEEIMLEAERIVYRRRGRIYVARVLRTQPRGTADSTVERQAPSHVTTPPADAATSRGDPIFTDKKVAP